MTNSLKKIGFSSPIPRLFTRDGYDVDSLIHFQQRELSEHDEVSVFECPDNWGLEAAALLASESAYKFAPTKSKAVEENTVPSWLWRHIGHNKTTTTEDKASQIFDRVVGAASYTGWKQGLFADERMAQAFFDETRYALMQRFFAIEPQLLSTLGLDWAYGFEKHAAKKLAATKPSTSVVDVDNKTIDAVVGGTRDKNIRTTWQRVLAAKTKASPVTLRFTDVTADWGSAQATMPRAALNLMCFRHNDGSVNIETLRHATRLLVVLLDLHDKEPKETLDIGFSNLAPLLMALALPYDSEAARTMSAALSAVITAEAYATSAELAGLRGVSKAFTATHEMTLRKLRNHHRAAYGDRNDYEKISVLPMPLTVTSCPDLGLVAAARSQWDEALQLARRFGLRHTEVTALKTSPTLALFMETTTQGIDAIGDLTILRGAETENFRRDIHPSVSEGLMRLGYSRTENQSIVTHIVGAHTLEKAPIINHATLRARGFDATALNRLEDYLPVVNDIRLAFTPWILGETFCRQSLKVPARTLQKAAFDLLSYLGFSEADIKRANIFCYGHGTAQSAIALRAEHKSLLMRNDELSADAKIRMAASVQSFISGDVGFSLSLPLHTPREQNEKLLLSAWRQGVKSVTLNYDRTVVASTESPTPRPKLTTRKSAFLHAKPLHLAVREPKLRAGSKMITLKKSEAKSLVSVRNK